jgi:hypothetical protein
VRCSNHGIHVEVFLQRFDSDLEVQFPHPTQKRLAAFPVDGDAQRRVAARHHRQGQSQSFLLLTHAGLDHSLDHGGRDDKTVEHNRTSGLAHRIAGTDGFQANHRDDVASRGFAHLGV